MSATKLAVFVEGQTEQIFVERLITEVASAKNVHFVRLKATGGGRRHPRQFVSLAGQSQNPSARYYVQIVDSSQDSRVTSDINDNLTGLAAQGFKAVLGIRDVYPFSSAELQRLQTAAGVTFRNAPIPVDVVHAVMEVEAWFLAEHTHFAKIGRGIAIHDVTQSLGFDPSMDDMQGRPHPAADLDAVYRLGGAAYTKSRAVVQTTVNSLDYVQLYLQLPSRMNSLKLLVDALDRFLV